MYFEVSGKALNYPVHGFFGISRLIEREISSLEYVQYSSISIRITVNEDYPEGVQVFGAEESKGVCMIRANDLSWNISSDIEGIYKKIFSYLEYLWVFNEWNVDHLNEVFDKIKSRKFVSDFVWIKGKRLGRSDKSIEVRIKYEFDKAIVYFSLYDKKNVISDYQVFVTVSFPVILERFFNKLSYKSGSVFLSDSMAEIHFKLNIETFDLSVEFDPKDHSVDELKEIVEVLKYDMDSFEIEDLYKLPFI
ncbi:hypothetical protein [Roseivirga pacifica]|uniref:hypothetical protein n=1 Tax=Roseivirga pacifica TaxID=1267423 RepID=UPI003BA8BF37